jgi:Tol biopolymer transport system component
VGDLRVLPPSGSARTLVKHVSDARYLSSGHLVYSQPGVASGTLFAAPFNVERLELSGPAVPIIEGLTADFRAGAGGRLEFDVSSSGTLVYKTQLTRDPVLIWLDSGGRVERIAAKPGDYKYPRLSPDGKRIAIELHREGRPSIWIYDIGRQTMAPLTTDSESAVIPIWSADGQYVVFSTGRTLAWTRSDGSGKLERLNASLSSPAVRSSSPDGKWFLFTQEDPRTGFDVWIAAVERVSGAMRLADPRPLLRLTGAQFSPAISPDGRWIAYQSEETGVSEVYVTKFSPDGPGEAARVRVSNDGGIGPVWAPNRRELLFRTPDGRVMTAAYKAAGESFSIEKPRTWVETRLAVRSSYYSFDISPDGKRLLTFLAADEPKPETVVRMLFHLPDELRRRFAKGER